MKTKIIERKIKDHKNLTFDSINIDNLDLPIFKNKLLTSVLDLNDEIKTKKKIKTVSSKQLDNELEDILEEFDGLEVLELLLNMFEVDFYHCNPILLDKVLVKVMSLINTHRCQALQVIYVIFSVKRPVPQSIITQHFLISLVKLTRSPNITTENKLNIIEIESISYDSKLIFIIFSRIFILFKQETIFLKVVEFLNNQCSIQATNEYLLFFLYAIRNKSITLPNDKIFFRLLEKRAFYIQQKFMICLMGLWKQMLSRPNSGPSSANSFVIKSLQFFRNILIDKKYSYIYSHIYDLLIYLLKQYKQQIGLIMMQQIYPTLMNNNKTTSAVNLSLVLSLIQNSVQSSTYLKHKINEQISNLNFEITFNTNPLNIAKQLKALQELCKQQDSWVFDDTNFENTLQNLLKSEDYLIKQAAIQTKNKYYKKQQN